jgi:hypothetical protein
MCLHAWTGVSTFCATSASASGAEATTSPIICMPYMYALYVCLICMPYMPHAHQPLAQRLRQAPALTYPLTASPMYALYVCLICMPYMYALYVCLICMPHPLTASPMADESSNILSPLRLCPCGRESTRGRGVLGRECGIDASLNPNP